MHPFRRLILLSVSASFPKATIRCHSVRSSRAPLRSVKRSVVANEKFATLLPEGRERVCGSPPRFPINVALLIAIAFRNSEDVAERPRPVHAQGPDDASRTGHAFPWHRPEACQALDGDFRAGASAQLQKEALVKQPHAMCPHRAP